MSCVWHTNTILHCLLEHNILHNQQMRTYSTGKIPGTQTHANKMINIQLILVVFAVVIYGANLKCDKSWSEQMEKHGVTFSKLFCCFNADQTLSSLCYFRRLHSVFLPQWADFWCEIRVSHDVSLIYDCTKMTENYRNQIVHPFTRGMPIFLQLKKKKQKTNYSGLILSEWFAPWPT